jgi:AbrB family looped-hinge helix DNA binding protein
MTTRLSAKGQLIIPRAIRTRHGWRPGTRILLEDRGDCVVLYGILESPRTCLKDLIGCTGYRGRRHSLTEMESAIARPLAKAAAGFAGVPPVEEP